MLKLSLKTSIGKINCVYFHSKNMDAPVAIVINSDVVDSTTKKLKYEPAIDTVVEAFLENGFSVLKFNLKDEKINKKDVEEESVNLLNLTAVTDWLHTKNLESKSFWVCGIDNGAVSALELVMRRPEIENYILISPNIKKNDLGFVVPCVASGMLVRASEDLRFVEEDCLNLQEKLTTKTETKIKYMTIYGAERDFDDELEQLKNSLKEYIKEKVEEDDKNSRTVSINKRRRRKKKNIDGEDEKIIYVNPIKPLDIDNI